MNKKMRELQAKMLELTDQAKAFMTDGEGKDLDKAEALLNQRDALSREYDLEARAAEQAKTAAPVDPQPVDAVKALATAARARFKANMNEATGADGGYTVPTDISTLVNRYKEQRFSLANLIDVEKVNTLEGRRTFKARAQHTGMALVGEGAAIGQTAAPKFEILNYKIKKYAGWLPVTNELLADSDAAISALIIEWLGEEELATENAQILAKVQEKDATAMTGIDDIKKAVNVTLAAFAGSVSILTNADGLQYLDTLKDGNKRPLLSPDPVKPMEMYLSVGVRRIPVIVAPNEVLASGEGGKLPFIVGDLREYVKQFDREQLTITTSDTAAVTGFNAFEQDMTLFRAIMRADWQVKDAAAIVRGELTPSA